MVASLRQTQTKYPVLCLVTPDVSLETLQKLKDAGITVQEVALIPHPYDCTTYKKLNYTKLHVFGLEIFQKIVYVDADMIILQNIDELFDKPHMTACRAGNNENWKHFNSGLMVIEPSLLLFRDMISKVGLSDKPMEEQSFLHSYFPEWISRPEVQLPSEYNTLVGDAPHNLETIKILHYVGERKPWTHFDPNNHTHQFWSMFDQR